MPTVQLFVTCLIDGFYPDVGRAAVTLLEQGGCTVEFPSGQTCCGQPAHNAGHRDQAARMAAGMVTTLDATEGPIVVPSGSCADMMIHHTPDLLAEGPLAQASKRVAERVRELTQYLVDDLGQTRFGSACVGCVAVYHPSCHGLRNLGIRSQPESLIDAVEGVERVVANEPEQCCGFGGLFSVEMSDVSAAIMNAKLDDLESTGAEVIVGVDVSCLMHLEGGLRRRGSDTRVRHIAEFLADGL